MLHLYLFTSILFSCGSDDQFDFSETKKNPEQQNDPNDDPDTSSPISNLNYYSHIRPMVDQKCIHCHYEGGRSFDMNTHNAFVGLAEYIARDVRDGGKPPPISKKDCRSYVGDERYVTEEDKVLLEDFVAYGVAIGDPLDATDYQPPSVPESPEELFDITLQIGSDYPFPGNEGHRCSVFSLNNQVPITLKSSEFFTNDTRKSWTSTLFIAPPDYDSPQGEHFNCQFSGEEDWKVLASWSPGVPPIEYGDGIILEENSTIILKQYWFPEHNGFSDFIGYWGLHTSDEIPERPTEIIKLDILDFTLPAGDNNITIEESFEWTDENRSIIGAYFRSSQLGMGGRLHQITEEERQNCLLDYYLYEPLVPQHIMFQEALDIQNGTKLHLACDYDNSSGNKKQVYQPPMNLEQTYIGDMALCFVTLYVR